MKTFLKLCAIAAFSVVAGWAAAQPAPPPLAGAQRQEAQLQRLGLTDDQAKQVTALVAKQEATALQQRAQLKVYEAQIQQAMVASKTDLGAVNALVDKKVQLQGEVEKGFLATATQIHQIVGDQVFFQLRQHLFRIHKGRVPGKMGRSGAKRPLPLAPQGTP